MENHKNSFEELKKILTAVVDVLSESNALLLKRVEELEAKVADLEQRGQEKAVPGTDPEMNFDLDEIDTEPVVETGKPETSEAVVKEVEEVENGNGDIEDEKAGGDTGNNDAADIGEIAVSNDGCVVGKAGEDEEDRDAESGAGRELEHVDFMEEPTFAGTTRLPVERVEDISGEPVENVLDTEIGTERGEIHADEIEKLEIVPEKEVSVPDDHIKAMEALEETSVAEREPGGETFPEEGPESRILNEAAKPDWFDWEVDYPAAYIDDVYKGISFNDRYEFVKELFNTTGDLHAAEVAFKETLDAINEMDSFREVVSYIRANFPRWDEQSDEVYRFYMIVRRRFNK